MFSSALRYWRDHRALREICFFTLVAVPIGSFIMASVILGAYEMINDIIPCLVEGLLP